MKAFGIGVLIALALGASALAEDDDGKAANWVSPKVQTLHDHWPKGADGGLLFGKVTLDCGVGANGYAADCLVKSSEPNDPRLQDAALALANQYKARTKTQGRTPLIVSVMYDVPPDWLHKPTFDDMAAVFPVAAKGQAGSTMIHCWIKTDGLLRSCTVVRESPEGRGFGSAGLLLVPSFLMKPAIKNGQPIETEVSIPISFAATGAGPTTTSQTVRLIGVPIWDKTPTTSEILAELDKKVGDKFADGKVALQCDISKKTGHLSGCIITNATEGMAGFTGAARSLTSKFEINREILAGIKENVRVNLVFSFPDMTSETWSKRYLAHPKWIRTISSDPNQAAFPAAAAKAGLKKGAATVDCVMNAQGALNQCVVVSESAPGLGFGAMAQQIAELFVANPWTEDGLPADGAHIKLPINMVLNDAEPAPSASTTKP